MVSHLQPHRNTLFDNKWNSVCTCEMTQKDTNKTTIVRQLAKLAASSQHSWLKFQLFMVLMDYCFYCYVLVQNNFCWGCRVSAVVSTDASLEEETARGFSPGSPDFSKSIVRLTSHSQLPEAMNMCVKGCLSYDFFFFMTDVLQIKSYQSQTMSINVNCVYYANIWFTNVC